MIRFIVLSGYQSAIIPFVSITETFYADNVQIQYQNAIQGITYTVSVDASATFNGGRRAQRLLSPPTAWRPCRRSPCFSAPVRTSTRLTLVMGPLPSSAACSIRTLIAAASIRRRESRVSQRHGLAVHRRQCQRQD